MGAQRDTRSAPETGAKMRIAKPGEQLGRGVYVAPWMGEHGELVLLAITSTSRLACPPMTIAHGADRVAASDAAWAALDAADHVPGLKLHAG